MTEKWIVVYRKEDRWRIGLDETSDIAMARKVRDGLEAEGHRAILIEVPGE